MGMRTCLASIDVALLDRLRANPGEIQELIYQSDAKSLDTRINLDKSWHCIHFMLTGDPIGGQPPLAWAILGGEEVGDDMGYGPPRILGSDDVIEIAAALESFDEAQFRSRYDPTAMSANDIYLADVAISEGDQFLEELAHFFKRLMAFYRSAAERRDAVILWIG